MAVGHTSRIRDVKKASLLCPTVLCGAFLAIPRSLLLYSQNMLPRFRGLALKAHNRPVAFLTPWVDMALTQAAAIIVSSVWRNHVEECV